MAIQNCAYSIVAASKSSVEISGWFEAVVINAKAAQPPVDEGLMAAAGTHKVRLALIPRVGLPDTPSPLLMLIPPPAAIERCAQVSVPIRTAKPVLLKFSSASASVVSAI